MTIRIIKHEAILPDGGKLDSGSYEVRHGSERRYFYFDGHPGRRAINRKLDRQTALERAQALARELRDSK